MQIVITLITIIFVLNLLQVLKAVFFPENNSDYGYFKLINKPINIGHRGASGYYPENTILSFKQALKMGARGLEFDLKITSDRKVLVFHDDDTSRMTGNDVNLNDVDYSQIKDLKILEAEGEKIPLLKDVLNEFPNIPMIIEIKDSDRNIAKTIARVIKETDSQGQILLGSFHKSTINGLRDALPDVPTVACEKEAFLFYILSHLGVAGFLNWNFEGFSIPTKHGKLPILTPSFIAAARAKDIGLFIWTINNRKTMKRLVKIGVDGIITDYPDKMNDISC